MATPPKKKKPAYRPDGDEEDFGPRKRRGKKKGKKGGKLSREEFVAMLQAKQRR